MQNPDTIQTLVQISRDGLEFYEEARAKVSSPRLRDTFARMAMHKRNLIDVLGGRLAAGNEDIPTEGTLIGSLRKTYADLRTRIGSDKEQVYVEQLEETEDRLLNHYEEALAKAQDPHTRSTLQAHLPRVRACHDEMRALKQLMAA